jgi:hypothetical protein
VPHVHLLRHYAHIGSISVCDTGGTLARVPPVSHTGAPLGVVLVKR